jgi:proteasome beta subunit
LSVGGATIVGLRTKNFVVIAGERRATYGSFIASSQAKKVFKINDRLAIGTAGVLGDAQAILRILREQLRYYQLSVKKGMSVRSAARLLSHIMYSYKLFPMMSEVIVAGIDEKPVLLVMDPIGSIIEDDYAAIGSGGAIAIGVIEDGYKQDLTESEARELVVRAVRQGIRRDALSGGSIDVIIIDDKGAREETIR